MAAQAAGGARAEESRIIADMRSRQATVVNVGEEEWRAQRPYGLYTIPAKVNGERYAALRVPGSVAVRDMGDRTRQLDPLYADEIAQCIIREQDLARFGVFVAKGESPTEQELAAAEKMRDENDLSEIESADAEWTRTHQIASISDFAKHAVVRQGMDREWVYEVKQMQACPGCGATVKKGVAKCRECQAILDKEKAIALGLISAPAPEETPDPPKAQKGK